MVDVRRRRLRIKSFPTFNFVLVLMRLLSVIYICIRLTLKIVLQEIALLVSNIFLSDFILEITN